MSGYKVYLYFSADTAIPIYLGVGKGNRPTIHWQFAKGIRSADDHSNPELIRLLRKIGREPPIIILHDHLTLDTALRYERILITAIGRKDLSTGPLLNRNSGARELESPPPLSDEAIYLADSRAFTANLRKVDPLKVSRRRPFDAERPIALPPAPKPVKQATMTGSVIPFRPSDDILLAVCDEICARWPDTFCFPPRPIAVGLGPVILAALSTTPPWVPPWTTMNYQTLEQAVECVLEAWTSQPRYWAVTKAGNPRIGLSGEPLGKVVREEADWAHDKFRAAFKAMPMIAPTPAQVQAWLNTGRWILEPGQLTMPARPRP
jgi:hypothetical protein